MSDTDVASEIRSGYVGKHCGAMLALLNGHLNEEQLTYEDWVVPMKRRSGRICLREDVDRKSSIYPRFFTMEADTLQSVDGSGGAWAVGAMDQLRQAMRYGEVSITPVMRENTPFE